MIIITQPQPLNSTITSQVNVSCIGGNNGSATVTASGGTFPYYYLWNNPFPSQTTETSINLPPGTWIVTVTDSNGCITSTSVTIKEFSSINLNITPSQNLCVGEQANILAIASGGVQPYTFFWNNIQGPSLYSFQAINSITVSVYTIDALGCTDRKSVV